MHQQEQIIKQQKMCNVMYMIWQVMYLNGQQKPIAIPTLLVSLGEAISTVPTATRVFAATAAALLAATAAVDSAHFYMCRSEC